MAIREVMGGDTGEDFSGAKSFPEWDPSSITTPPLLSSCGGKMDGGRQGPDRPLRMMDLGPDQKPSESSGL